MPSNDMPGQPSNSGRSASIVCLSVSSDESWIASGHSDGSVRLWTLPGFEGVHVMRGHEDAVRFTQIAPTGGLIASSSNDATVRVWHTLSGKCLHTLDANPGHMPPRCGSVRGSGPCFCPEGKWLATTNGCEVSCWEMATGRLVKRFEARSPEGDHRETRVVAVGRSLSSVTLVHANVR